ncbi:hypothetical protein [Mangrovibacter phragmitis]|uniref:hypothetical protein n=1 Tax=Mangrovibacter phragmitis TaxID=1691903 RepID=UPI003369D070
MKSSLIQGYAVAVIFPFLLTGCAASFQPVLPDYTGANAAYLRFDNSPVYTSLREASGQLLEPVPYTVKWSGEPGKEYSVNARFSIMGIKSSYGKKVNGSGPVSPGFASKSYKEYRVKAGEVYSIQWVFTEKGMYSSSDRVWSASVTPVAGHTYEITLGGGSDGNDVVISDVTSH